MEEWKRRERAQWPVARKKKRADYVIDNGGARAAVFVRGLKSYPASPPPRNEVKGIHPAMNQYIS